MCSTKNDCLKQDFEQILMTSYHTSCLKYDFEKILKVRCALQWRHIPGNWLRNFFFRIFFFLVLPHSFFMYRQSPIFFFVVVVGYMHEGISKEEHPGNLTILLRLLDSTACSSSTILSGGFWAGIRNRARSEGPGVLLSAGIGNRADCCS